MSYQGHPVIDMDSHIREYWDLDRTYKEYIEPRYREKYEKFSAAVKANQRRPGDTGVDILWSFPTRRPLGVYEPWEIERARGGDGESGRTRTATQRGKEIDPACHWDPVSRLRDMDVAQIDSAVMFPSQSDGFCALRDVGFEHALHFAYHRYMNIFCSESGGRLRWTADVTMRDMEANVADLKYWAERDENFVGMFIPRMFPDGRMLDHPDLHPLFAASQELDLPIWIHGESGRPPFTPGHDGTDGVAFSRAVLQGWGGMTAMLALIGGGVFDRFPNLRACFVENDAGWMPWFMEALDQSYPPGGAQTPHMKRKPSEVVRSGQVQVGIFPDEVALGLCVDALGEDCWIFTTDYPHGGSVWPDGVPMIAERTDISERAKIKMLGENAQKFCPRMA